MTYGEYYYLIKYDMKLVGGAWISNPPSKKIPTKMPRDKAAIYYNKKFRDYWKSLEK